MQKYYHRRPNNANPQRGRPSYARNINNRAPRNTTKSYAEVLKAIYAGQQTSEPSISQTLPPFVPQHSFASLPISDKLKQNIFAKNYLTLMPIQDKCIPEILNGKDIIGVANTGTGKTATFLIPLIDKVTKDRQQKVLIISPTRELATQITDELRSLTYGLNIASALCIGGVNENTQKNNLRNNPNFVIGTPGRLKDFVRSNFLQLHQFNNVVLDEVDRMVDIGFINDIKYFISLLPAKRQSLFFSATISGAVSEILKGFVTDPVTVSVAQKATRDNIDQQIIKTNSREHKISMLHDYLITEGFAKVLIFGRTKYGVQKLTDELIKRGFKAGVIHGNRSQGQRQRVLDQFKRNEIQIMLATDVASRGLDIEGVSHVINYDLPATYEDYIHRIGRTGRVNAKGSAITFIDQ